MKKLFLFIFALAAYATGFAQKESYFVNPVIRGDVPDPSIIRFGDTYYAVGTSS